MPDPSKPPPVNDFSSPRKPVREARFGGLLEGRRGEAPQMHRIASEIEKLGIARPELELEGGRFSLLMDDRPLPGEGVDENRLEDFAALLQQLVDASPQPGTVESTLRCTLIHEDEVQEVLFAVMNGAVRLVGRTRPIKDEERPVETPDAWKPSTFGFGGRHAVIIAALLIVIFGIAAWQSGYIDKIFSTGTSQILLETGTFGRLLQLEIDSSWGDYEVRILRGPEFPESAAQVKALEEEAVSAADRAAINAVSNGGLIYVQLRNEEGRLLAVRQVELRPLLTKEDGVVIVKLPGRIGSHEVRLSLDAGGDPK